MRTHLRSILAATTVVGLLAIPVAAQGGDTTVTFTVDANSQGLAINQEGSTADLTSDGNALFDLDDETTVAGSLPETTVTDARGGLLQTQAWTVQVQANGDWVNDEDDSKTVGAANARAYIPAPGVTELVNGLGGLLSGMSVSGGEFQDGDSDLAAPYTLLQGTTTTVLSGGEITYTPAIEVTIPEGTAPGTYSAVVTQSVS